MRNRSNHDCFRNPTWAPDGAGGWIEEQAEPPLPDHADTIREALEFCAQPLAYDRAVAALDALVAELAEARAENERTAHIRRAWDQGESELAEARAYADSQDWHTEWYEPMRNRAEAAEAENARLKADRDELLPLLTNLFESMVTMNSTLAMLADIVRIKASASGGSSTDGAA